MGFWEKRLGVSPAQPPQPQQQPWWQDQQQAPVNPQQYNPPQQQAPDPFEGLAVDRPHNSGDQQIAAQIQGRGFIKKPPEWVRRQPTDRCPQCDSATYAAICSSNYGGQVNIGGGSRGGNAVPAQSFAYKRCFACGHSSTGIERQGVGGTGSVAPSRQTAHGGASLRNFGVIDTE